MKTHYAKVNKTDKIYKLYLSNELIMGSEKAVELVEHYNGKDFPAVIYFPASDVDKLNLIKSEKTSICPIKGKASYWNYKEVEDCVWSYHIENPELASIDKHFAFDQGKGFRVVQETS